MLPTQFDASAQGMVPDLFDDYLLTAVQDQGAHLAVIMKGGKLYKNNLQSR